MPSRSAVCRLQSTMIFFRCTEAAGRRGVCLQRPHFCMTSAGASRMFPTTKPAWHSSPGTGPCRFRYTNGVLLHLLSGITGDHCPNGITRSTAAFPNRTAKRYACLQALSGLPTDWIIPTAVLSGRFMQNFRQGPLSSPAPGPAEDRRSGGLPQKKRIC